MKRDPEEVAIEAKRLSAAGVGVEEIARTIGVAPSTLYRHYFREIGVRAGVAGRRPHDPTMETRSRVTALVAAGFAVPAIALAVGVSAPTLRKHYRIELANGHG